MEAVIQLGVLLTLLLIGYVAGTAAERAHYASIRRREEELLSLIALPIGSVPGAGEGSDPRLVVGAVVISVDYFKRFAAGLRNLLGGRIRAYESVIDRGRREAVLRMKEAARASGHDAVIRMRIETSRIASSGGNGKGTAGIEVVAFGTAVRLSPPAPAGTGDPAA